MFKCNVDNMNETKLSSGFIDEVMFLIYFVWIYIQMKTFQKYDIQPHVMCGTSICMTFTCTFFIMMLNVNAFIMFKINAT